MLGDPQGLTCLFPSSSPWSFSIRSLPQLQEPSPRDEAETSAYSPGVSPERGAHTSPPCSPTSGAPTFGSVGTAEPRGVSCQHTAGTSLASVCSPAAQALNLLPSSVLQWATGVLSHESARHRTRRASIHRGVAHQSSAH